MIPLSLRKPFVYICICNAVTDSDIRRAADNGVRNFRQLKLQTGCGSTCAKCVDSAREVLGEALVDRREYLSLVRNSPAA